MRTVGRYILHGELASGGMATVHFGRLNGADGFSRTVAIKRLHAQFAKDAKFVTMFRDEARLVARIRHPNVVPTLDIVTTEGEIFIVMEYVEGESFSKLLAASQAKKEAVPVKVAASIVSSVLHGLHAAHQTRDENGAELGIVHRDVSPQNILVGVDGSARILDFGVAKAAGRLQTTREGELKGKIAYMAPEQLSGSLATLQSDVYAAAVVLWESLTQRRLFDGEVEAIVFARALEGRIEPPSKYNPQVTADIDQLVLRGLARDPAKRFANARQMALAIEQTIGLASPSELGSWVERLAQDSLRRRAAKVAAIESSPTLPSSADGPGEPASGVTTSDRSSFTASHAAISIPIARRSGRQKLLMGSFVVLAAAGVTLGVLARQDAASAIVVDADPNHLERAAVRSYERIGPLAVAERAPREEDVLPASSSPNARPATVAAPVRSAAPAPARTETKPADSCDPPYTIDQATGRRTYKRHCI